MTLWRVKLATLHAWAQGKASDSDLAIDWPDAGEAWGWFGVWVGSRADLLRLMRAVLREPADVCWNQSVDSLSTGYATTGTRCFATVEQVNQFARATGGK